MDWTATVTAIGALLGGLALPLAFIQLGALRQDRLRAQINKVGAWGATPEKVHPAEQGKAEWKISLSVRNNSELPIVIQEVNVAVQDYRGNRVSFGATDQLAAVYSKWGGSEVSLPRLVIRETVVPGDTWTGGGLSYRPGTKFGLVQPPKVIIIRIVVTDAAGRKWEIRRAGPPRRITWWRQIWRGYGTYRKADR